MGDHVYRIVTIAGSSGDSIEDAIRKAVAKATEAEGELRWFELCETRGHIENGKVAHYQVVLRVGMNVGDIEV